MSEDEQISARGWQVKSLLATYNEMSMAFVYSQKRLKPLILLPALLLLGRATLKDSPLSQQIVKAAGPPIASAALLSLSSPFLITNLYSALNMYRISLNCPSSISIKPVLLPALQLNRKTIIFNQRSSYEQNFDSMHRNSHLIFRRFFQTIESNFLSFDLSNTNIN